jgi:hypothetical protein
LKREQKLLPFLLIEARRAQRMWKFVTDGLALSAAIRVRKPPLIATNMAIIGV